MSADAYAAVLFDLDGTLVDSVADIAAAMNGALGELGLEPLKTAQIAGFVGNGPRMLARCVLAAQPKSCADHDSLIGPLLAAYLRRYEIQIGALGTIFPGAVRCLEELAARGLRLGVVTNSLQHLAEKILSHFGIASMFQVVLGSDRVTRPKPDPAPLREACRRLGVPPDAVLMVGDSVNDASAAHAASCDIVILAHGYNHGVSANRLGCDVVDDFAELSRWIRTRTRHAHHIASATLP